MNENENDGRTKTANGGKSQYSFLFAKNRDGFEACLFTKDVSRQNRSRTNPEDTPGHNCDKGETVEIAEDLKILLKKVCSELRRNNLPFCLAGGWAVSMIGVARTTVDIDILIVLDENIKKQVLSILENSFRLIQGHEKEMELKTITIWRNIISLKGKQEIYVLDLLKADNDFLKSVIERRIEIDFEGTIIPVISIEDLVIIKLASFRKQDQVDIENLIHSGTPIDWVYLETTIKKLNLDWNYIVEMN